MTVRPIYEIDDVRVDLGRMAVTRGGSVIPLEPKAFDVLAYLVEHHDRLVTKDELLEAVWAGTFVTPNVLTRAIAQIRKGLGDESQDGRYIETVARRGYRVIAPVTVLAGGPGGESAATAVARMPGAPSRRRSFRLAAAIAALAVIGVALAAVLLFKSRDREPHPRGDLHLTRLTNRRGFNGTPAIAPDGHAVVYASDATGTLELYLASLLPGGAEVQLTHDGGQNLQPAWSPDGQWIAFHSRRRRGVWIVPAVGGVPQQITDFGSDPAWSPDSARIVFTSGAGGLAFQSSLWIVDRDGRNQRALTQVGKPAGGHGAPVWSHDGRLVAFVVARGGWDNELWTVDVASGAQHLVSRVISATDPCFSSDDRALYWGGTTEQANGRLLRHALTAEGAGAGQDEVVQPVDGGLVNGLSLGADGTLAFAVTTLDSNLWTLDVAANGRASAPVRLTDDTAVRNTYGNYSPDGRIAYLQVSVGSPPTVWLVREDGTGQTPLLAGTESFYPQWAADGTRILLVRPIDGRAELAWVDIASRRVTPAGPLNDLLNVRLSPDDREFAFHRIEADGTLAVWVGAFDGSRRKIASDREAVSYPAWSPDGRSLAVELKRGDSTVIGVVDRAGGAVVELTAGPGQSWPHSWAPDNDRIAFAGERDGVWNIYTVSRRTKAVIPLTSLTSGNGYVRYPSWSPKGNRIVFERAIEQGSVWTVKLPRP